MVKAASHLFRTFTLLSLTMTLTAYADASDEPSQSAKIESSENPPQPKKPFQAFTGKISKNKVRLRLQPSLDSPILRELAHGDLLVVIDENDDFYAVQPPADIKAYVFRTFVLDNTIEGNHVNVRLEPDLESPVIAQLNSGDKINGIISPLNSKWFEIPPPATTRFFVAKEFVDNVGDPTMLGRIQKRRDEANRLLEASYSISQTELQKPFNMMNLEGVFANLNKIINQYSDLPEQMAKAKTLLNNLQESYVQKKIAYLEAKSQSSELWQAKNSQLNEQIEAQQQRLSQLEQKLEESNEAVKAISSNEPQNSDQTIIPAQTAQEFFTKQDSPNNKMTTWIPIEQTLYEAWAQQNSNASKDEYDQNQLQNATLLTGIVEPYNRMIKNKPGDYVLINQSNHIPIAYLYSTNVNLQDKVGQEVTIRVAPRPNNNFAFPAYFVLTIE